MVIEQIYTGCLAQGAYYIESNGEAAIVDPLREVKPYLQMAERRETKIKYIFETHFHADFVSGHVDLAKKTGAPIIYGPTTMQTGFESTIAKDGQEFMLGDITIKLIHTPGHTMESSCYLVLDEDGKEKALFTGDTLFIGDVGRPDLAQKVIAELTQEKLAKHLYNSLRNKIMPLPDDIIVYPAHGAGSACGKNMSNETTDTLGNQKRTNYALRPGMTEDEFVEAVLTGLTPPPGYFPQNVLMNIQGYESIDTVLEKGTQELTPKEFELVANETDAVIIDTRVQDEFKDGFIPNSINISLDGNFAVWAGTLIPDIKQNILVVAPQGREEEAITRLARVGFDNTLGILKGGFNSWQASGREIDTVESISAKELGKLYKGSEVNILDVRKASEYESEHAVGAINAPLDYVNESMALVNKDQTYYVHCRSGYRSMSFVSILQARGFRNLIDVAGGIEDMKETASFKMTEYVAPTTML